MSSEKSLTPQIRFKEFTEVWEQRKLQDLFAYGGSGGTPSSNNQDYYNGNIPFLNISDLKERNIRFTEKQITALGLRNSAAWIVPAGSISLAMYASVGKVGIICNDTATSQAFYNMVVQDIFVRNFLYTRLEKADTCNEWEPYISTGTQRNLNAEKVRNFKINIPSIHEMNHIGSIFEVLDSLITLHQRKLDVLKKIKSALLEKMFPKDGSNVPEIRFAGYTEAWEQHKLSEVFEYLSSQIQASQAQAEGRYKLFDASSQIGYTSTGSDYPLVTIIKDGSGVGRIRLIPYRSWFIGTLGGLLANKIDIDFGYALLQNIDFSIYIIGSTIPHIYFKDYSAAPLLIAKNKEQQMIGKVFSKLDSLITLHQRKLDALKKIKSALLEKMFV